MASFDTLIPPVNTLVQFQQPARPTLYLVGGNELPGPIERVALGSATAPADINIDKFRVLPVPDTSSYVYLASNDINFSYPVLKTRPYFYVDSCSSQVTWSVTETPDNLVTQTKDAFLFRLVVCNAKSSCSTSTDIPSGFVPSLRYALQSKLGDKMLFALNTPCAKSTDMRMLTDEEAAMSPQPYVKLWFHVIPAGNIPADPPTGTATDSSTSSDTVSVSWLFVSIAFIILFSVFFVILLWYIYANYESETADELPIEAVTVREPPGIGYVTVPRAPRVSTPTVIEPALA